MGVADYEAALRRRINDLCADDDQLSGARPSASVTTAMARPGLKLAEIVRTAFEAYADRAAMGQRRNEIVSDPDTGGTLTRLLPEFDTISYRELWSRIQDVSTEWRSHSQHPLSPGDFVCTLGFISVDYATVDLACLFSGAVAVPLQAGAPAAQHVSMISETKPTILAVGTTYLAAAVDAILAGAAPSRLIVFDYEPRDTEARSRLDDARSRLADAGVAVAVETLADVIARGTAQPPAPLHVPEPDEDSVLALLYTSGSTGTPKGAIYTDSMMNRTWLRPSPAPVICVDYMPMSHMYGRGTLARALSNGGTCYCAASTDMSSLFEDIRLVRPTELSLVPRVCELIYQSYTRRRDRLSGNDNASDGLDADVMRDVRYEELGGRVLTANCASAPLAPELRDFLESCLDVRLATTYGSTEMGGVLVDGRIMWPNVIEYKLVDAPELGYFNTDKPYPRGELLVKTRTMTPGYYQRPDVSASMFDEDGFYRSGDIMAATGPDQLKYVDRRNNVIKLAQGEFVAVAQLETIFITSPLIEQIFIYGRSEESYLLAVVVPDRNVAGRLDAEGPAAVKAAISTSLQRIAAEQRFNGYQVPRDFLLEVDPFTTENGLLTGASKLARPQLNSRYAPDLDALYRQLRSEQADRLRSLRSQGHQLPVIESVLHAAAASIGLPRDDVSAESRFIDLGGDSLSALSFSELLKEIFDVAVPVGVIIDSTADLSQVARYIEAQRTPEAQSRPTFAAVHGLCAEQIHARDLTLDKFIDAETFSQAAALDPPGAAIHTVLLTGVTGFLGRFVCLNWMQRLAETGGKVICITRGSDAAEARRRITDVVSTDPALRHRFDELAQDHLEVLVGDLGAPILGLAPAQWDRLAATTDLIVHPAAHVNHVLPYDQLFVPNVVGTAELIRLAITTKLKTFHYVSSIGAAFTDSDTVDEDADVRVALPTRNLTIADYAGGYSASKWAAEVLMREVHDLCRLPVVVFRPDMIMADSRYVGQINAPDLITRLLFSLVATGIAPRSFYGDQQVRAHYDGLPVDFVADVVTEIGPLEQSGYRTYNVVNPHNDGVSIDEFVDWLVAAGNPMTRIDDYDEWLSRFQIGLRALPEKQRQQSVLAVLDAFQRPLEPLAGSSAPCARLSQDLHATGREIPHLSSALLDKYSAGLKMMGVGP